ncbi:MAG: hypothetical protein IAE97_06575 [Chthoniobacterales bacterium]|nr:hypothetical protein [Chthoniobacterales bacterium]
MRRAAAILAMLVAVVPVSRGEEGMVWEPARILTAEEVAASGAFVPLPVPTTFDNFRYPFIQPDRSVIFIANDHLAPPDHRGRAGIYHIALDGKVSALVSAGDPVSNAPGSLVGLDGLKMDGERMVFRANFGGAAWGIALWEKGKVSLLAPVAGPGALTGVGYPDISGDLVVFVAKDVSGEQKLYGVDLSSRDRQPHVLVATGEPIPGMEDLVFREFAYQQMADGGSAVFRGFAGVRSRVRGIPFGGVYRKDATSDTKAVRILDTTTPIPGGRPGETFSELQNALPCNGTVVVPNHGPQRSGIYYAGAGGAVSVVADTATQIPDLFEGSFTHFNKWVGNCAPWILFRGYARNYAGVFALNVDTKALHLLIDSRLELDGKEIRDFEIAVTPKVDDQVVVMVEFVDNSSAVYVLHFGDGRGQGIFRPAGDAR